MNYRTAIDLILTDLERIHPKIKGGKFLKSFLLNKGFKFMFWWRMAKVKSPFQPFFRMVLCHYSTKYGIEIPLSVKIGRAFKISHAVGIVINGKAKIGDNVTVCQFLTVGSTMIGKAAEIGDNVYVGPNVCLINDVKIGNNVIIGSGAIVTKSIPSMEVWAGNPAHFIKFSADCSFQYGK